MKNRRGQPLGFCRWCQRMRWLSATDTKVKGVPYGICNTCADLAEGNGQ